MKDDKNDGLQIVLKSADQRLQRFDSPSRSADYDYVPVDVFDYVRADGFYLVHFAALFDRFGVWPEAAGRGRRDFANISRI
jgi:hypothetical protein